MLYRLVFAALLLCALTVTPSTAADSDAITDIGLASDAIMAYDKVEVTFRLAKEYENPYDFTQIDVQAVFTHPEAKEIRVPGFWYEGYTVDPQNKTMHPSGVSTWMVRFTPTIAGAWKCTLLATDAAGTNTAKPIAFQVGPAAPDRDGFIRQHRESMSHYAYENSGKMFFGAGLNNDVNIWNKADAKDPKNMNWGIGSGYVPPWTGSPGAGLTPHTLFAGYLQNTDVVTGLGVNGGKAMRISADRYYHPLEAKADLKPYDTPITCGEMGFSLGRYHQPMCFILDKMYAIAEQHGIGIMHCVWDGVSKRPYAAGFCYAMKKQDRLIKQRLRYTIARWGYSTSHWITELFNEYHKRPDRFWLDTMAWLRNLDPYGHPITFSSSTVFGKTRGHKGGHGPDLYNSHNYSDNCWRTDPYTGTSTAGIIGEFGENWQLGTKDPFAYDPDGHWVRQTHWNAMVSGWAGALTWWTKPLYGKTGCNAYATIYPALAKFLEGENMAAEGPWSVLKAKGQTDGLEHVRLTLNAAKDRAYLWIVRTPPAETIDRKAVSGKWITAALPDGTYTIQWWDSRTGDMRALTEAVAADGQLKIIIPDGVTRDIAAKVFRSKQ